MQALETMLNDQLILQKIVLSKCFCETLVLPFHKHCLRKIPLPGRHRRSSPLPAGVIAHTMPMAVRALLQSIDQHRAEPCAAAHYEAELTAAKLVLPVRFLLVVFS
jgi:hypothetical protein